MASTVDTVWAFLDKHGKALAAAGGALVLFLLARSSEAATAEQAAVAEAEAETQKLIPPKAPVKTGNATKDAAADKKYWADKKAQRTALYAKELFGAMYRVDSGGWVLNTADADGTDVDKVLKVAQNCSLGRITFAQLSESYRKQLPNPNYPNLTARLKAELSDRDLIEFYRRMGLTPEQTAAEIKKKIQK